MSQPLIKRSEILGENRVVAEGLKGLWHSASLGQFAFLMGELALLALVIRQFQVESSAFLRLCLFAFGGFAVHYFLPRPYQLPFFLFLSLSALQVVLGLSSALWVISIGLLLIGICHLPASFSARVVLLILVAASLAVLRLDLFPVAWSHAIWPILGSMFMFRLIVYLYDLRHDNAPRSLWQTLSYFFLLPNVCFPLFPVVDYKTFRRSYYSDEAGRIYQKGIDWMARGLTHLILYRLVYYHLALTPSEVVNSADLARYLTANFLLYLRVSGQFHVIIGLLHLFGFNLPETHHRYFLASSFTDFWRRINIYWKDFMLKIFYYPVYFKLRALGATAALVLSTLVVFLVTWFLHSYQWFWLRGSFLLSWQDGLFWGILALLVIVNSLYEARYGRERKLGKTRWGVNGRTGLVVKTAATFTIICILWSIWTSESLAGWLSLWSAAGELSSGVFWLVPSVAVGALAAGGARRLRLNGTDGRPKQEPGFYRRSAPTVAMLIALTLLGIPAVYVQLGPDGASFVHSLRSGKLSRADTAMLEKGYYEDLIRVDRFNSQLWEVYMNKPLNWLDVRGSGLERFTGDFAQKELVPSFVSFTSHGKISTNRWGMRDRDYGKEPAPGTFRVALLGASTVMGWGVGDGETFETLLEERLNRESAGEPYAKFEILNFAVPGYQPPQQLIALGRAIAFKPNAVFYVATGREASRSASYLVEALRSGVPFPYEDLRQIAVRAGVSAGTSETLAMKNLLPFRDEILSWIYRRIVSDCRERGVVPVWVFLPQLEGGIWQDETEGLLKIAQDAGFIVLPLSDVYKGHDVSALRLLDWDYHPNSTGHRLIASRLYEALADKRDLIFALNGRQ
ncbi:MAG: hypothetical protein HY695_31295 [Deltaproteobacteria bacterium]|nr:hypothetical protein [Deltaproteobacteria bacterium]